MNVRQSMKRVVQNGRERLARSYGVDQLGMLLTTLSAIALLIALRGGVVWICLAGVLLCYETWRMLSTQHSSRRRENDAVMRLLQKPVRAVRRQLHRWRDRKTRAYVRCPSCGEEFALPKGKGKLRATCPHCGEKSVHTV